jgi:hypothetical protein
MHDLKRDIQGELKGLRLNGIAGAWGELIEQDGGLDS